MRRFGAGWLLSGTRKPGALGHDETSAVRVVRLVWQLMSDKRVTFGGLPESTQCGRADEPPRRLHGVLVG